MKVRELSNLLQNLGEDNLDKEIVIFDTGWSYTPTRVKLLDDKWGKLEGKVLID